MLAMGTTMRRSGTDREAGASTRHRRYRQAPAVTKIVVSDNVVAFPRERAGDGSTKDLRPMHGVPSAMSTIERRLLDLVAEQLGIEREKVTLDSTLETLGVDSLDAVELIMVTENQFGIHIPDEESPNLDTPRKMLAYIEANAGGG